MSEKGFAKSWVYCPECQNVIHGTPGNWPRCEHDWRPNSPYGVLANQRKELALMNDEAIAGLFDQVRCYQSPVELVSVLNLIDDCVPDIKTIVEIGSYHGGTANIIKAWFPNADLFCVDCNFEHWLAGEIATRIEGDTRSEATLTALKAELYCKQVDFLFIDGDHSPEGAWNDWNVFSPLVRDGGVIAFHDTGAIPAVKEVFDQVPGRIKINIVSFQGIGLIFK